LSRWRVTVQTRYGAALNTQDSQMVKSMQRHWVQFARTGDPTDARPEGWPVYDPKADRIMNFSADGGVVQPDSLRDQLDLEQSLVSGAQR
jgi:para-nitrobenzyl esterase